MKAIDKLPKTAAATTFDNASCRVTSPSSEVAADEQRFEIIGKELPATTSVFATSVSGDGKVVVGFIKTSEGTQAFRWSRQDGLKLLPGLEGDKGKSRAAAVSADGNVIVGSSSGNDGRQHAVIWNNGSPPIDLPSHGGLDTVACMGVSADGQVVAGHLEDRFGNDRTVFIWNRKDGIQLVDSTMVLSGKKFTAISNALTLSQNGKVVGGSMEHDDIDFNSACVWVEGQGAPIAPKEFKDGVSRSMPLFMATRSSVTALTVNSEGVVAGLTGRYQNKNRGGTRGYHLADGKFSWLENADGATLSFPNAISEDGSVVVGQGNVGERSDVACFWSAKAGVVLVEEHLRSHNVTTNGLKLSGASGVSSDAGTMVGGGTDSTGRSLAWIASVEI